MENITVRHGDNMQLPAPDWQDPYTRADQTTYYCSPGAQLVISDVNPSFDTEFVPGSAFSSFSGDISGLNVANEAQAIWDEEHGGASLHFIGESGTNTDGVPSPKTVSSLGNIRGLAPAEPTRRGGYYSAALARYGFMNDLRNDLQGQQNINTFAVALASPLPKIEIPINGQVVTVVPFAKSVGQGSTDWTDRDFQPTNTIVDFFVDTFANTDPQGSDADSDINDGRPLVRFRINYEDVEQGADHDMDAIVLYELRVNADNTLTVELTSEYAAGSIIHHMGYVISGTSADGVYLEVRDLDPTSMANPVNFALDTPPGLSPGACAVSNPPAACNAPLPFVATRTFTASTSPAATLLENPLWYAAKYGSAGNEALKSGEPSPNYFLVTNAGTLQQQLEDAFAAILGVTSSASAVATNSTRAQAGNLVYQARFRSEDWTGELRAYKLDQTGTPSEIPEWDAGTANKMPAAAQRNIFTFNPTAGTDGAGVSFTWNALSEAQRDLLGKTPDDPDLDLGEKRLDWLRGVQSQEQQNGGSLRDRSRILGDIVNSNPLFVKALNLRYERLPTNFSGGSSYPNYVQANLGVPGDPNNPGRRPMLYVGANDGMLHAFDADTGVEQFAYVPNLVMPELYKLTQPGYNHRYFVDGQLAAGDVYLDDQWKTVLIGGLGAGGRGIFALDITDPDNFDASNVLWEFTDPDLGHVMSAPIIRPMANGKWVALFGNGYNSDSGRGFLFAVDVETGELIKKIDTGVGSSGNSNGLAAPGLLADANRIIETAYAGDLRGNVWRFDLSASNPQPDQQQQGWSSHFASGNNPLPLFVAYGPDGDRQPITSPLEVMLHPNEGYMVLFGTGRYFAVGDNVVASDEPIQSVYGIWDKDNTVPVALNTTRDVVLLRQEIEHEEIIDIDGESRRVRVTSDNAIEWADKYGWYIDLVPPSSTPTGEGERVIFKPIIRNNWVFFSSLVPSQDPCVFGGFSFFYGLNAVSGSRTEDPLLDLDRDGELDDGDLIEVEIEVDGEIVTVLVAPSAVGTMEGIMSSARFIEFDPGPPDPESGPQGAPSDKFCFSKTDGDIECIDVQKINRGTPRASWRQLR